MADVPATLQKLAARLRLVDPSPQPPPQIVYADPKGAVQLGEFPCVVLALAPQKDHTWRMHGNDVAAHQYAVAIWVFVGGMNTPLAELHSRVLPWPKAIATALLGDITLGGTVDQIGMPDSDVFFTYQIGPIAWGVDMSGKPLTYFGLSVTLGVQEKPSVAVD